MRMKIFTFYSVAGVFTDPGPNSYLDILSVIWKSHLTIYIGVNRLTLAMLYRGI